MKVAQLKALLSKVPDGADVVIHDAHSDYAMPHFEVRQLSDGTITLAAGYCTDNCSRDLDGFLYEVVE